MKMKYVILLAILLLISNNIAFCQNDYGKVWVQGGPVSFTSVFNGNAVTNNYFDTVNNFMFEAGHSNICDSAGNLILCSNGFHIYNQNRTIIDNGDSLVSDALIDFNPEGSRYTQSSLFLPLGNGKYCFITATASDYEVNTYWQHLNLGRCEFDLLLYNIVDMKANSGQGKVVKRKIPLLQNVQLSKCQMMACRHGDGKSWWLLKQVQKNNFIYKFLITQDSVYGPFTQSFAQPVFSLAEVAGQSMFNDDGTRYATTCRGTGKVFVADFDRCSGNLSNPLVYQMPFSTIMNPYDSTIFVDSFSEGLCFSPNGRFVYVSNYYHIQQLDLQDPNPNTQWTVVAAMDTTWDYFQEYSSIYPGPDGKIYIGNWNALSAQMSVINNPNIKGAGCNFCPRCLRFPKYHFSPTNIGGGVMQPPCMANYRLGATNPICWPVGIEPVHSEENELKVYPNPATESITIEYTLGGILEITDLEGRITKHISLSGDSGKLRVNITNITNGIYFYRHIIDGQLKGTGKIVIIH